MELTDSQVNTALEEAFTCYLAFLSHTHKHQQSRQPRRGKGRETTSDVSIEIHFQSRVATAETCLRYTDRIARRVLRWAAFPRGETTDTLRDVEHSSLDLGDFLPEHDDSPFLDPFSGKWVLPPDATEAAGPSRLKAEPRSFLKEPLEPSKLNRGKYTTKEMPPAQAHPVPKSMLHKLQKESSPKSSNGSQRGIPSNPSVSSTPLTPSTSSLDDSEDTDTVDSSEDADSDEDSSGTELEDVHSLTTVPAAAFYQIPQNEVDDEAYARLLQSEEQKRVSHLDESLAQAQKLAADWDTEQKTLLRDQEAFAKKMERKEKVERERIERDREAARKAEQDIKWELEALVRETAAMRAEERQRRESEEAQRLKEEKDKVKNAEREKKLAAMIEEKKRAIREETRKKEEAAKKEAVRKEKALRQVDCIACMETKDKNDMAVLSCKHIYCIKCLNAAIKNALKTHSAFKCCRAVVGPDAYKRHLSSSTSKRYTLLLLELSTKHPKYCCAATCSRFLPPTRIKAGIGTCVKCETRTCVSCGKKEHKGICKEDKEGKKVKELAKKQGWKECPRCSQLVERTMGCLHMTCRCKAEWCYACLRDWGVCNSTCGRE